MYSITLLILAVLAAAGWLASKRFNSKVWFGRRIDEELTRGVGDLEEYRAYQKRLPLFRFIDLHRAVEEIAAQDPACIPIESEHQEELSGILAGRFYIEKNRFLRKPEFVARPIDVSQDAFFATDRFLIVRVAESEQPVIIRLRRHPHLQDAVLEVGATSREAAQRLLDRLLDLASELSIYRRRTLEACFESEVRDNYGDVEQAAFVDVRFKPSFEVRRADIILETTIHELIERNVVEFHRRREQLRALGLPGKRGLLFYGPPGTGKTYTCKYLAHALTDVTTLVSSGRALFHIRSICQIARMLKPALIVLEDVDLVFSSRDLTMAGASLGELMDELDGFAADDEIVFILTTNAIERVEAAIKDRPGRISQCVYFGLPGAELRRLYLTALVDRYEASGLDMGELVALTERTSQAFLRELVFRAVQIASESQRGDGHAGAASSLALELPHFRLALREMKDSAGIRGAAILGFDAG